MKLTTLLALAPLAIATLAACAPDSGSQSDEVKQKTTKRIEVSLYYQELKAFDKEDLIYDFDATTGSSETPTPSGHFKILTKHEEYTSQKYNKDMPYTMFITNDGVAIHGAYVVALESWLKWFANASGAEIFDWFGSHGCIRLSDDDASELYDWAPLGTPVDVIDDRNATGDGTWGACTLNDGTGGDCIDAGECANGGGTSVAGLCPGPSNIQCCVPY